MRGALILFILKIAVIFSVIFNVAPRELILFVFGAYLFYFFFSEIKDALFLFIVSIPLFTALPLTTSFDSMAEWRILILILFIRWLFYKINFNCKIPRISALSSAYFRDKKESLTRNQAGYNTEQYRKLLLFVSFFFIIALLSLIGSKYPIAGIKKIIFLLNIFLLFPVVVEIGRKEGLEKIIRPLFYSSLVVLAVGYFQLISVFFISLHNFWKWWAAKVILVFYGNNLAALLNASNTWFSYYKDSLPTLRMFSVFPDSHSFAMFSIASLPVLVFVYWNFSSSNYNTRINTDTRQKNKDISENRRSNRRRISAFLIVLALAGIIFSGSRGSWLSILFPLFLAIWFFWRFKRQDAIKIIKPILVFFAAFFVLFPITSFILSAASQRDLVKTTTVLSFERAVSAIDIKDISVKGRFEIWRESFKAVLKRPFLGVGIGNFPVVLEEDISTIKKGSSAHSLYLDFAVEIGIIGLLALLFIFKNIWTTAYTQVKAEKKGAFALMFIIYFSWILSYSLFDVVLLNDKVLLFFVALIGVLYTCEVDEIKSTN